jgi:hypothetical protein
MTIENKKVLYHNLNKKGMTNHENPSLPNFGLLWLILLFMPKGKAISPSKFTLSFMTIPIFLDFYDFLR